MITYLANEPHTYTMERYLETWGKPLTGRFRVKSYRSFLQVPNFEARPGTYIFSDIERMVPTVAQLAAQAWGKISELGGEARLLNHPTRSMRRYELLRTLFEHGVNTFNIYRLVECRQPQRWPVFIRAEHEHTKNLTPLIHTPEELEAVVAETLARGFSREDKLIVEFCDTRDDQGLFYKYAAFLVGERVIPWHRVARRQWVLDQRAFVKTPEVLEKERHYVETNPHEREIREIFRLARIDYGKIDYAILGDRLQVWEINTNPSILAPPDRLDAERKALLSQNAEHYAAALASINVRDAPYEPGPSESSSFL